VVKTNNQFTEQVQWIDSA